MVKTLPTVERSTQIRFGKHAQQDQGENTIVLNASNTAVDASNGGAVYVSPVRFDDTYEGKSEIVLMMYNTITKELTESGESAQDIIGNQGLQAVTNLGNTTSNSLIFYNNTVAFATTGNVGIANALASHTLSVGSNLYVDDKGTDVLVVSGGVGIIDTTTSTSATTGALKVAGGISTQENLNVGAVTKVLSATDASSKTTGALIVTGGVGISKNIHALNANFEDVEADSVNITDTTQSNNQTTGALKVAGGLGVAGNVHCGNLTLTGNLTVTGNTTVINANNLIVQDPIIELGKGNASGLDTGIIMNNPLTGGNKGNVAMIYDFSTSKLEIGHTLKSATDTVIVMNTANALAVNINGTLGVTSATTSSSKTTGAVTIGGGLGVVGDIHATHVNFEDVEADSVTITDNTTSTSATTGALKVVGGISTQENLNVGAVAKVISATDASSKTTGALIVSGGVGISKNIHALHANFEDVEADSVTITDNTTSSSATTGALKVAGGISTQENLSVGGDVLVVDTTAGSAAGPEVELFRNITGADGNYLGQVKFQGNNDADAQKNYAKITGKISDASDGTEDGLIEFATIKAGSQSIRARLTSTNLKLLNDAGIEVDGTADITNSTGSTSATTGALKVVGGISTQENLNVGAVAKVLSATDASSKTTGALIVTGGVGISKNIHALHANFEDVEADSVNITDTTTSTNATTGALKVAGGISTQKNLNVGSNAHISSNLEVGTANLFVNTLTSNVGIGTKTPSELLDIAAVSGDHDAFIRLRSGSGGSPVTESGIKLTESTRYGWRIAHNANTDSLRIAHQDQNDAINGDNYMVFKSGGNIGIAEADPTSKLQVAGDVNITDTTESKLRTNGALIVAGGIGVASNVNTTNLHALGTTASASKTTGTVVVAGGVGISGALYGADANLENVEADSVTITDTTTSTSATTGALKVVGGISTQENLNVGAVAKVISATDASSKTTGALIVTGGVGISKNIHALHANFEDVEADSVNITDTTVSSSKTTGALKVAGGLGVAGNVHSSNIFAGYDLDLTSYVGRAAVGFAGETNHASFAHIDNNTTGNYALKQTEGGTTHVNAKAGQHIRLNINNSEKARLTGAGDLKIGSNVLYVDVSETSIGVNTASPEAKLHVEGNAYVSSTTDATTTVTGALIVAGGMGIAKKIVGQHANFEDVEADSVTVTDTTTSTSATTGALKVAGGISTQENLNVGAVAKVISATDASSKTTGALIVTGGVGISKNIHALHANFEDVEADSVTITDTTTSTSATTGALKVAGGISTQENLNVGAVAKVISATDASSKTTGALIVTGGVGISKNIHALHANFEDVEADSVTVTDTTTSTSATTGALKVAGGISTQENLHIGGVAKVHDTTTSSSKTTGSLIVAGGAGVSGPLFGAAATLDGVVTLTDATEATSSTTGALKAAGGVGIAKDVYVGERAYVTGGLITNTGGVGKKTYSYSADLGSGASIANATYVLDFTNHPFHAKVTAMLIESDDEISTLIFDVIGGKLGGGSNSAYVPALGQQSIISTSTMNTPWDSTIATSLTGTTVTIKPANACSGVVRFNIFVEYLSHETAGQLSSITNSGTSAGSGAFGY